MKLFIADDEMDVREGIRYLLDWSALGFMICGEGKNGQDALDQIIKLCPDVVLLDIRMPKLTGLEVVKQAQEQGFQGKFIILSGYSDFSYAQEAIRYGVTCYLTKPIDEEELKKAVLEARDILEQEHNTQNKLTTYRDKARSSILQDILCNTADYAYLDYREIMLESPVYQVILYTNYNQDSFQTTWDFASILRIANKNHNSLDYIRIKNQNVILLKGNFALNRFQELLNHYIIHPQKGSPLDSLFLTFGRPVYAVEQIHESYEDACFLMKRRFFCENNQHSLGYQQLQERGKAIADLQEAAGNQENHSESRYAQRLSNYIQTGNQRMIQTTLEELKQQLYYSNDKIPRLKHFLADIMIEVKSSINHNYAKLDIPFPSNAVIISTVEEKYYLYEILEFFSRQFEMCTNAIGSPTRECVMDGILEYIQHNFQENLKLSSIAELFGYNSSYLGKVFTKTTGRNFNAYVDEVRIDHSKQLLADEQYKVYEISQMVGYSNVDYFHKKFKKYVGISPAEYRRNITS